jgi:trans-aconitate methyltransferase
LLGCYEQPLQPFIEQAIEAQYSTILNIGCAEGYYAVGMARRMPQTRVMAWQIAQEMQAQNMTKTALAKKMRTSRAALNRLLDENDSSLTLTTLASAAAALGKKIDLRLAA